MSQRVDLHTHSTASDGSMTPRELARLAAQSEMAAIALTDHDTIDGLAEALDEGDRLGLEIIPGIEISVDFVPEMHMLGYFPDRTHTQIIPILQELWDNRNRRNPKIIAKLNEMGYDMTMEEAEQAASGDIVGRPHIAKVMLDKGYVRSIKEAFDRFLGDGKPAFFKKDKLTPEEGIRHIRNAGGVPVLAHPIHLNLRWEKLDGLLGQLKQAGLAGMEVYYVDNTENDTGTLLRLAIKHDLIATGGSDFHGSFKPDIHLGVGRGNLKVPYDCVEKIKGAKGTR